MATYVAATGGRDFDDASRVAEALDFLQAFYADLKILHGDASGADRLVADGAAERGIVCRAYPADWGGPCAPEMCEAGHRRQHPSGSTYCPAAAVRRNAHMIRLLERWRDAGHSVGVLAFPGGKGTADMIERALDADIAVSEM